MNQAQALYHLQNIDQDIAARQTRQTEIEQILGKNTAIAAAEQQLSQAEAALLPWQTQVRNLELESKSLDTKLKAVEQRLYSGSVSNPKELQDMQEEIASLQRRGNKLEDDLLEAMLEVENAQAAVDAANEQLTQVRVEWSESQSTLLDEQQALQTTLTDLHNQREAALTALEPESLSTYKKLYASKRGHVVSPLIDNTCRVCGVSQTTIIMQQVRQGYSLVHCSNCGRILVLI